MLWKALLMSLATGLIFTLAVFLMGVMISAIITVVDSISERRKKP